MTRPKLTRVHYLLIAVIAVGAVAISAIGFAGSYSAVRSLAESYGFRALAKVLPIGVDAGIAVLLALDLLLSWLRMPYPALRHMAWLLTAATIFFNAKAAWPDPTGVALHAVIPLLFVIVVEAGRHAVARLAGIKAGEQQMEGLGLARWALSPLRTFALWRRKHLWGIGSRDEAVKVEQQRLVYQAQLRRFYGRGWRRSAPRDVLLPLQLAALGVPLHLTYKAGLKAAGLPVDTYAVLFTDPKAGEASGLETSAELRRVELEAVERPEALADQRAVVEALAQKAVAQALAAQSSVAQPVPEPFAHLVPAQLAQAFPQVSVLAQDDEAPVVGGAQHESLAEAVPLARVSRLDDGDSRVVTQQTDTRRTPEPWGEAFRTFMKEHGRHPEPGELAQFMYERWGQKARGKDEPVSLASVRRYYTRLKDRFPLEDQQQLDLAELTS